MNKEEIIDFYLDNEILISPDMLDIIVITPLPLKNNFIVLNKDTFNILNVKNLNRNLVITDFEKSIVQKEKYKNFKLYNKFVEYIKQSVNLSSDKGNNFSNNNSNNLINNNINSNTALNNTNTINNSTNDILSNNIINNNIIINNINNTDMSNSSNTKTPINENNGILSNTIPKNISSNIVVNNNIKKSINENNFSEETNNTNIVKEISKEDLIISKDDEQVLREKFLKYNKIKIISNYVNKTKKWSVQDFVGLYNSRFKELEKILRSRQELQSLTSIARISAKKDRENVALIGVVYDKGVTKAGNIMLTIEDPTGMIKVVVTKAKEDIFKLAEEIQLDETIGITGMFDQIIFASSILLPDIPLTKELKKSPDDGYFVVIADTQLGSKLFLEKEFDKFLAWINGEIGSETQREVASKVKYIFIGGDLVDGIGVYPNQEFDLTILDIKEQYAALANLLKKIPEYIPIILCPGNHDVGRISEPQPAINKEYADALISMPNIISLSNPSIVNIYAQPENGFDGFDVMFYHGYSFVYYSEHIPSIRKAGGQKRPDLIMKYLLQRRHLAPTHTSTMYIPDPKIDPLVIDKIPDFLITGHIHRASVSNYKNVTCFNASCWVSQSDEQERRGLEAQPGRAFIVNMRTREVKMINFLSKEDQEKDSKNVTDNSDKGVKKDG